MYLNPQIHDTQDTFPVAPEIRILHVYPVCIPHVSWLPLMLHVCCMYAARYVDLWMHLRYMYPIMYLKCILHVSWSPLQIHESQMYPECISHVCCILHLSYVPLWIYSRYAFRIVSRMYPVQDTCISVYPDYRDEESKIHVSWFPTDFRCAPACPVWTLWLALWQTRQPCVSRVYPGSPGAFYQAQGGAPWWGMQQAS